MEEQREQLNITRDRAYIKNDIIAQQLDGNYCKFSKLLNAIAVRNLTSTQYITYWYNKYKDTEYGEEVRKLCEDKLSSGLVSRQYMINLIKKSKDCPSEIKKTLDVLGG